VGSTETPSLVPSTLSTIPDTLVPEGTAVIIKIPLFQGLNMHYVRISHYSEVFRFSDMCP
jgi:hypothetical protein